MELIENALRMSVRAHKEQVRKDDQSPYVVHPIMVSRIVERYGFSESVVAAAIVHDVLEDTMISESELRTILGDAVADIVIAVSEDKTLPWEERKKQYIDQVAAAGAGTRAVSVADKIHNAQSLLRSHARDGATVWEMFNVGKEKKLWFERTLCDRLSAVWQHPLMDEYERLVVALERL